MTSTPPAAKDLVRLGASPVAALRRGAVLALVGVLSACTGASGGGGDPSGAPAEASSQPLAEPALTVLALGDSWPYGAHCNGCIPFPELYAEGLEEELGAEVELVDLVTNGGTSASLLESLREDKTFREAATHADVVVISTGANDIEPAGQSWKAGTCGGADSLDCFRALGQEWHGHFDQMLEEIHELRAGEPTAVRLVTNSNEFLADPGLIQYFGADFGLTGGATITALHHDTLCAAAAEHGDACVDLRPVLNGPGLDEPRDVNTQEAMQAVADALVESGLAELDTP